MPIIIERYYQLLSLSLISEMLECEKICLRIDEREYVLFLCFWQQRSTEGEQARPFGLQPLILATVQCQVYAGR